MSISAILCTQWTVYSAMALLGAYIYRCLSKRYAHFAERNVPFIRPNFIFGNMTQVFMRRTSFMDIIRTQYDDFKGCSFYGVFHCLTPIIYLRDPELIKHITHIDFEYFVDHMAWMNNPDVEPFIGRSLYGLNGDKWHSMRATLSPAFSGGRVREMFRLVAECSQRSVEVLQEQAQQAAASSRCWRPDMRDLVSRFANDVIASLAFGTEINSIKDPENSFYRIAKKATNFGTWSFTCRALMAHLTSGLSSPYRWRWFSADIVQYFSSLVLDAMKYRSEYNIRRSDMIQQLLDARNGYVEQATAAVGEDGLPTGAAGCASPSGAGSEMGSEDFRGTKRRLWADDELTAQCFMFFMTGYGTITTTLGFLVYELVANIPVQSRLIAEIDEMRAHLDGRPLSYNDLDALKYMGMVISETMRKWPPLIVLQRNCVKDYLLRDSQGNSVMLKAGDNVLIPLIGMQRDDELFPDPELFDPERFSDERSHQIRPFTYLPFGSGPRNCVGARLAITELKAFVFYLLSQFTLAPTASTQIPLKIKINGFTFEMEKDLEIQITLRSI